MPRKPDAKIWDMAEYKFKLRDRVVYKGEVRSVQQIRDNPPGEPLYFAQRGRDAATSIWAKESELNPAKYIGVFAAEKMAELQHRIAKSGNEGGYASLFMDLARLVVEEYPDIAPEEKAAVLSSMKGQTALLKMRTGIDASAGLGEAERILSRA
jgi:hypothetical protein